MYLETYIEKAIIEAYVLGNQTATEKSTTGEMLALHAWLQKEKLLAELLLEPVIQDAELPPHAILPIMTFVRGGRFTVPDTSREKGAWSVFRGGDHHPIDKELKSLTYMMLVFAVIYMVTTLVLVL